ncbi:MAG: hypothetical protein IKN70_04040 [Fibrobacter sp.]|nr:hypothetical protein [Fibrobacter sp.]
MIFAPWEKLHYAETHFKFKLPWSLLFRPWPEIIADMAFQAVPGETPVLWIVLRDANRFPVVLEQAKVTIAAQDAPRSAWDVREIPLNIEATQQFEFHPLPLEGVQPGRYCIYVEFTVKRISDGKVRTFRRWSLPGLRAEPLTLQVLSEALPKAPGYAAGEMHCHTHYSADHVEFGATPKVFQQAAKAVGLDFVCCTDHAYDFAFTTEDYTREAESPMPRFQALRDEIAALPESYPLLLAGEEVSAGNSKGENVHMTVLAPDEYLPGLGDCGRYWLENRPTRKIPGHLSATKAHCFAAHPMQPMGIIEKFVFRRGYWSHKDLNLDAAHKIRGIQFWNGMRDEGFMLGRQWWIEELGKENYLLPIGGNDAHGDLNDTTAVGFPLFTLKYSRDHVFGKVRTVVKLDERRDIRHSGLRPVVDVIPYGETRDEREVDLDERREARGSGLEEQGARDRLSLESLNKAFAGDNCYITDGPALWWERDGKRIHFHARCTADMGGCFRYIRIFGRKRKLDGKIADKEVVDLHSMVLARASSDITMDFEDYAYLRAECETATGKFALTSAAQIF